MQPSNMDHLRLSRTSRTSTESPTDAIELRQRFAELFANPNNRYYRKLFILLLVIISGTDWK